MSAEIKEPTRLLESDEAPELRAVLEQVGESAPEPFAEGRAWARLQAARGQRRRAVLGWGLAGAALGALMVAVVVRWSATATQPLPAGTTLATVGLSAGAQVARAGGQFALATAGERVEDSSSVRTQASGRALVRFSNAAALVRPGSELKLSGDTRGALALTLTAGSVVVASDKRAPGAALTVSASGYRVTVVGTLFSVTRNGSGVAVQVQHGVVRVEGPGTELSLKAGSHWSSDPAATDGDISSAELALIAALRAPREGELPLELGGDGGALALDGVDFGAAPLSVLASPAATAQVMEAGRAEPLTLVSSKGHLAAVPRVEPGPPPAAPATVEAEREPARVLEPTTREVASPTRPGAKPGEAARPREPDRVPPLAAAGSGQAEASAALRAQELLQKGRSQLRAGKLDAAAAALEQAAAIDSPKASLASYELGLLKLRRLGDAHGAVEAFQNALRLSPEGPLAPDVSLSLIEALLACHEFSRAEQQAQAFLERFPTSERRDTVRLLRANIHREWGDCRAAMPEYDALSAQAGPEAEDAMFFAAACERREGREARFRDRLTRLLEAYPHGRRAAEARAALEKSAP